MSSPDPSPPSSRVVRVFVSSTFQDMHAERDVLVKRVFPVLRKRCEGRGVVWGEVDLRWGVTDEEKAEGKVLPICMAQIRRCRPYFIGLLGERYGWVPEEIPADVRAREPWLGEYGDRSVTELEILGGVLGARGLSEQALFYLRDPAYVDRLAEAEQPHFREGPTAEEIARYGPTEAGRRAEARRAKLAALKARIRQEAAERGMVLRDGYPDPEALADLVRQDLEAIIDRLYPEASKPAPLDQEAALHEAFAAGRARVYVARPALFERLDAHVAGEGPPLAVVGESGMGKSALLANWALGYRDRNPEAQIVLHFVGASAASADWQAMLRRLLAEFNRRLDLGLEVPDEAGALRATFATALHRVAARTRLVLVVDALNQLEDREGSPDLAWLPPVVPPNVRLLVSTLDGRPREAWSRRGWPTLGVAGLGEDERRQLIAAHLAQYAKALPPDQVARLAAAPQTANPLFLRALLEELRLHGDHWTLRDRLDHYLGAPAIPELYGRILRRYEADYEGARPGLVRDATTLLWAARRGLSEAELLALLGTGDDPLPQSEWAPLFLAAEEGLVDRSGLVGFSHDHLRRAVQLAYLPEQEARDAAHLRLAEHFDRDRLSNRAVDELPWQLAAAGRWEELADLLADLPFLERAWGRDEFGVLASWSQVERNSDRRLVEAYRQVVREPSEGGSATGAIAVLCWHTGHGEESLALFRYFEQESRSKGDLAGLQVSLGDQAMILYRRGDLNGAVALLKEQERICRELGNPAGLSVSLGNQAPILQVRGDLDGAMALMKDQERICRELGDPVGLSQSICNQALILHDRGDLDGAMALLKDRERLCRELGDPAGLQVSLGNQAVILHSRGDLDGAMVLLGEQEALCRTLGDPSALQRCLKVQEEVRRMKKEA